MVKIRLRRMGAKKAPYYRVVVADSRYPRDGRLSRRSAPTIPVSLPPRLPSMLTAPASGSRLALSPLRPFVLC